MSETHEDFTARVVAFSGYTRETAEYEWTQRQEKSMSWKPDAAWVENIIDNPRFQDPADVAMATEFVVEMLKKQPREDLETPRMLVLSTAHVTAETVRLFRYHPSSLPLHFRKGVNYGWFIPLYELDEDDLNSWRPDLLAIRSLAEANDCTWIMLDRDAEIVPDLPTYES